MKAEPVYKYEIIVEKSALDENGHVNNVTYVRWMQDAAVQHYQSIGGVKPTMALKATWVVRSHHVEYLRPAYAGDIVEVQTWVVDIRRVRSLRRYRFIRKTDGKQLVKGETDWVFVDAASGVPRHIPKEITNLFTLVPKQEQEE